MISGGDEVVDEAISAALVAWREHADIAAVRRALLAAFAALESDTNE